MCLLSMVPREGVGGGVGSAGGGSGGGPVGGPGTGDGSPAPQPSSGVVRVRGRVQGRMQRHGHASVDAHRGVEHAVQVVEGDGALGLLVDVEAELVPVQVEQHPHRGARLDAALAALRVGVAVQEPGPLPVDVHRPALVVLSQHLVLGDVHPGHAEAGVRVGVVAVHAELPVVDAAAKADRAQGDAMLVAGAGQRAVVRRELQPRRQVGVEREPRHLSRLQADHLAVLALARGVEGLDASVVHRVEVEPVYRADGLLPAVHVPEVAAVAVVQLQDVALHARGDGRLPRHRHRVVLGRALLRDDGGRAGRFHLDEVEVRDGAARRLVVQGEVGVRRYPGLRGHVLVPGQVRVGHPCDEHGADLQEGGWVRLLEGLDAELDEARGLLQLARALRHLLPERAQPHVPVGAHELEQRGAPLLQRQHERADLRLDLRLQLRAVLVHFVRHALEPLDELGGALGLLRELLQVLR